MKIAVTGGSGFIGQAFLHRIRSIPDTSVTTRVKALSSSAQGLERLRAQHPGKYENKVSPVPDPDAWFHVKVVLEGKNVSVYVNQSATPSLQVVRLSETKAGKLAMWAGNGSNASFANLVIAPTPKKTAK